MYYKTVIHGSVELNICRLTTYIDINMLSYNADVAKTATIHTETSGINNNCNNYNFNNYLQPSRHFGNLLLF